MGVGGGYVRCGVYAACVCARARVSVRVSMRGMGVGTEGRAGGWRGVFPIHEGTLIQNRAPVLKAPATAVRPGD